MLKPDLLLLTATELEKLLSNGSLTSLQIVEQYLEQISKYNGYLHAMISTAPRDLLLTRAKFLDDERVRGSILGPLHGIPIIVKVGTSYTELWEPLLTEQTGQHCHPS